MDRNSTIAERRWDLVFILVVVSVLVGHAEQQPSLPSPVFEVATIKPNTTGETNTQAELQPGGRFVAVGATVQALIRNAYRVGSTPLRATQVVGGPPWINAERFDIVASGETVRTPTDIWPAIRDLLATRFTLVVHREMRQQPVYALVVIRKEATLGRGIRRSDKDCEAAGAGCIIQLSGGRLMSRGMPLDRFAAALSTDAGRPVVDRTGLVGRFDVDLSFTPDVSASSADARALPGDAPSLFTALQEQLGLKLESATEPLEVLVIDRVERPTGN